MIDLFYYRNRTGLVAVSYDEGNTIVVPAGRVIPVTDAWEEVTDDCSTELTPEQRKTLDTMLPRQRTDEMGHIINAFSRRRRIVEARDGVNTESRVRPIPEGASVVVSDIKRRKEPDD